MNIIKIDFRHIFYSLIENTKLDANNVKDITYIKKVLKVKNRCTRNLQRTMHF